MKKLITLTAGLLLASSAFASVQTTHSETTLFSDSYQTKAEAFNAGFDITDSLAVMSEGQLKSELPTVADGVVRAIAVDGTQITVEEFAVNRGDIQYRAVVDVDYHFNAADND